MKVRDGFVSNSSSTAFIITNISHKEKTLADFVLETSYLLHRFVEKYHVALEYEDFPTVSAGLTMMLEEATEDGTSFAPGEDKFMIFGDEQGTIMGRVYDYMLRDGGRSHSFMWRYEESLR